MPKKCSVSRCRSGRSESTLFFINEHIRYIHMSVKIVCNFPFNRRSLCTLQQYFIKENWFFWRSRPSVLSLGEIFLSKISPIDFPFCFFLKGIRLTKGAQGGVGRNLFLFLFYKQMSYL